MKGSDIVRKLGAIDESQQQFIKWWRNENDFADYELIDTFKGSDIDDLDFAGYELLSMDEMMTLLRKLSKDRVDITQKGGEKLLVWRRADGVTVSRSLTPETLLEIFDSETGGDVLM